MIRFFFCWSHHRVHARTDQGLLVFRCLHCGDEVSVLQSSIVVGPKATPDRVLGEPRTKAVTARPHVTKLTRRA